jgi:large subunit ribosomal protein L18e
MIFMQPTGPTKIETRKLITEIEKHGKKTKQKIFLAIAEQLSKARRARVTVNLRKLSALATANAKKVLVIPGKVLSIGEATAGMQVAALQYSKDAKQKIEKAKGKAMTLKELINSKAKPSEMTMVK